jgi:hypothetical protein
MCQCFEPAPISKFICPYFVVRMVCLVGAIFIQIRAKCPYIQYSVDRATDTCCSMLIVGDKSGERGRSSQVYYVWLPKVYESIALY